MNNIEKFVRFYRTDFGKSLLEKEAEYIYKELKDCQKILDVGCGTGIFEQKLSELDIIGLDNSKKIFR